MDTKVANVNIDENETINYLNDDFEAIEAELELVDKRLDKEQGLRIEINEGLETAMKELEGLQAQLPKEQMKNLLQLCGDNVMETIVGQFGLASLVIDSRDGGAVTTTHNFEKGRDFIATDSDKQRYDNWEKSKKDSLQVRKDAGYDRALHKARDERIKSTDTLKDAYTGKPLAKDNRAHLDHIVPVKEIESNAKAHLSLSIEERVNLATNDKNLAFTDGSINQSKSDSTMKDFVDKKGEKYEINKEQAMQKDKEAREFVYDGGMDKAVLKKQAKELIATGAKDAAKMAVYTAIGAVLKELVQGLMQELREILNDSRKKSLKEIFKRFKERLQKIWANLKAKWKDIFAGSMEAAILSFLSNIVVFIINTFATTLKRIVKIIRAGFVSLCQAVKILANPPKDMPQDEVGYAALKVLTAGLIVGLSLGLAEGIATLLKTTPLATLWAIPIPFTGESVGDAISITLSAVAGGVLTTIALYYMDKWRSQSKENRLQIQIMTKSGEIVQYKIAQTWFILKDAWVYIRQSAQETAMVIKKADNEIKESGKKVDSAIDDMRKLIEQAKERIAKISQRSENDK